MEQLDEAGEVQAPPPPPPPPPLPPPTDTSAYDGEQLSKPLRESDGFSGKIDVVFEQGGKTEPVQLTVIDGKLSFDGRDVGRVTGQRPDGTLELELLGKPSTGRPSGPAATTVSQLDNQAFPSGRPETYIKTQFPATPGATADRQAMIDTVVSALPTEKQAEVRTLLEKGELTKRAEDGATVVRSGVSDASLEKAFNAVLEARKSPGTKPLELELVPERTVQDPDQHGGDSGMYTPPARTEAGKPVKLSVTVKVDEQGRVNGAPLVVDELTRLNTEMTKLAPDLKLEALRKAGASDDFIANTTPQQRDEALAKLRYATLNPGTQTVTLSHQVTENVGSGDNYETATRTIEQKLTLKVDDKGNVDGKPPFIEVALSTNRVMEQLPMAEKRAMLQRLGFQADDLKPLGADRATEILTKVALKTREPGEHSLEVDTGPDKFAIALKVSSQGEIESAGVTKLPPPPKKKSFFQKIIGPVLTVASIAFPAAAPFIRVIQAGIAIANGARGAGLVGAVLGGAAGVAGIADVAGVAGAASVASSLSTAASVVNSVNGTVQSLRSGDLLGAFSSAVSLGASTGAFNGLSAGVRDGILTAGDLAGVASTARSGDLAGAASGLFGAASAAYDRQQAQQRQAAQGATSPSTTPTRSDDDEGGTVTIDVRGSGSAGVGASDGDDEGGTVEMDMRPRPPAPGDGDFVGPPQPPPGAVDDDEGGTMEIDVRGNGEPTDPGEQASPGAEPSDGTPVQLRPEDFEGRTTSTVRRGDNLTQIAARELGDATRWPEIYAYNRDILDNPNALQAGQELKLPPPDFVLSREERNAILREAYIPPPPENEDQSGAIVDRDNDGIDNGLTDFTGGEPLDQATADELANRLAPPPGKSEELALAELIKEAKDKASLVPGGVAALENFVDLVNTKNWTGLKQFLDNPGLVSTLKELALDPKLAKVIGPIGEALDRFGPVLSATVAAFDETNSTQTGRGINALANGLIDVLVGKSNPIVAFADTALSLAGLESLSPSKNLAGGVQSAIALIESLSAEDRSKALDAIIKKNESGQNGLVIQGYTQLSQQVISPFVNDVIFGVMDYFKKDPAVIAAEQRQARDRMRANIRQQGG